MARRWDTDDRGTGVGDARALLPEARRLLAAMDADGWVAEEPEAHLLPHLHRACADEALPLELVAIDAAAGRRVRRRRALDRAAGVVAATAGRGPRAARVGRASSHLRPRAPRGRRPRPRRGDRRPRRRRAVRGARPRADPAVHGAGDGRAERAVP